MLPGRQSCSTVVEKPLPRGWLDLGNMLAIDTNQLDKELVTTPAYLLSLARTTP